MSKENTSYKVTIIEESETPLTNKERVMLMTGAETTALEDVCVNKTVIKPVKHAILHVINSTSEDGEYNTLIIFDESGDLISTGSSSFIESYKTIVDTMSDSEEEWGIRAIQKESKNYKGKFFYKATLV